LSAEHRFERVMVAGAGTMGQGIAQLCVEAGLPTLIYDVSSAMLPKAKTAIEAGPHARYTDVFNKYSLSDRIGYS